MKKLILFMVMLAITFGIKAATAETLHVPMVAHFGASDKTMISVANMASEAATININYVNNEDPGSSSSAFGTNTLTATTTHTATVGPNYTFLSYSDQSLLFGSTTNQKRATVTITSSGAIQAGAIYVHLEGTAPTGFVYPVAYLRTNYHAKVGTGALGLVSAGITMQNWIQ